MDEARYAARMLGPLAGWLTVASFANIEATLNRTGGSPVRRSDTRRALGMIGGASAVATILTLATCGNLGYAGAAAWGLSGIVVRNVRERNRRAALAATLGLGVVAGATALARILRAR